MKKSRLLGAVCVCLTAISINANAVVLNTINGVEYEWLELTVTAGMSRLDVEAQLSDINSALYGYEYASRTLIEDLLLSYSSWDGVNGFHGDSGVVSGIEMHLDDFGRTRTIPGDGYDSPLDTVDGYTVQIDGVERSYGMYGTSGVCGTAVTCYVETLVYKDAVKNTTAVWQHRNTGWDSTSTSPYVYETSNSNYQIGSYLVRPTIVPIPPALFLFATGLLGLVGIVRRKKA